MNDFGLWFGGFVEFLDSVREIVKHHDKPCGHACAREDGFQAFATDAEDIQRLLHDVYTVDGLEIPSQVVTLGGQATADYDSVCPVLEGGEDVQGVDASATWDPDYTYIVGVLHPHVTGGVRGGVAAPLAGEGDDDGLVLLFLAQPLRRQDGLDLRHELVVFVVSKLHGGYWADCATYPTALAG